MIITPERYTKMFLIAKLRRPKMKRKVGLILKEDKKNERLSKSLVK